MTSASCPSAIRSSPRPRPVRRPQRLLIPALPGSVLRLGAAKHGERAPGLFFLLCGSAEALRQGSRLGLLRPGDVFGEISLLRRSPATADVRAVSKCWALSLPRERFQEIMVTYPQVLEYVSALGDARQEENALAERKVDLL